MPTSNVNQISDIMEKIIEINPKSILDVGAGAGRYGVLCREYFGGSGKKYPHFRRRIDGIEIFEEYISPIHKYVYSNIYVGNALNFDFKEEYQLVLMIDVLEHFSRKDGKKLLEKFSNVPNLLISVPKKNRKQGTVYGNKYEEHKTQWTLEQLLLLGNCSVIENKESHIVHVRKDD